jgi:hypothetical protein
MPSYKYKSNSRKSSRNHARKLSRKLSRKHSRRRTRDANTPVFPWYANEYKFNLSRIKDIVSRRNSQLKIYTKSPANEYPSYRGEKFLAFNKTNAYYIIKTPWESNLELNYLTDYFTEKCRMNCQFGKSPSVLEYWKKNYQMIQHRLRKANKAMNNYNVREEIYAMNRLVFCNNFRISLCLDVLDIFKPKKWLDISAGWGDRLISALLSPHIEVYCGVDPNPCLHPGYKSIIKHLNPAGSKQCFLIQDGFETAVLPDIKFDLVFSSPPYFNLEVYSNSQADSITQYDNVDAWFNGFLMPSIKKSIAVLAPGGYIVLYIAEAHDEVKYIPRMLEETDKLATNAGRFYYTDGKRIREFYCWRKL